MNRRPKRPSAKRPSAPLGAARPRPLAGGPSGFEPLESRVLFAVTAAVSNGQLVVTGDNAPDTITVSHLAPATTVVNGQFFAETQFPGGILVNAGGGADVINLVSTVLATTLDGQEGADQVNLGENGRMSKVAAPVFVQDSGSGAGGETRLTLDDHANPSNTIVTLTVSSATGVGTIAGLAQGAVVTYSDAGVTPTIRGGNGFDSYAVIGSDAAGQTVIGGGGGDDNFQVTASRGVLMLDGGAGSSNFVKLGSSGANGGGGGGSSVTANVGETFVDSDGGNITLNVEDAGGAAPRTVTISTDRPAGGEADGVITGMTSGSTSVHFDLAETKDLTLFGGTGGNTFTVADLATPSTSLITGRGNDTVNLQKTDTPLVMNLFGGNDVVGVGAAGSTQGVRGDVSIHNGGPGGYELLLDDSADPVGRNVTMTRAGTAGEIAGLAPGTITYHPGITSLAVLGGTGGNTFTVDETLGGSATSTFPGLATVVAAGQGADTVNVLRTLELLSVTGGGGHDTFNVGLNNNARGVRAALAVANPGGAYDLNLNSAADASPRNVLITRDASAGIVSGLAEANVRYHLPSLGTLNLKAGSGGNTITIDDPAAAAPTADGFAVVSSGTNADTVNVLRTFQPLTVRGQNGADVVNVGAAGSVQGVRRPLLVSNAGSRSALTIDNSADPVARSVAMGVSNGTATVGGLAPAEIRYFDLDVSAVTVAAGPGGNTFTVDDTADSVADPVTTLNTGAGPDTVHVRGTTGPLNVNGQNGRDAVNVGAAGSVQSVRGTLNVTNAGSFSAINLDDSADAVGRVVTFDVNAAAGQGTVTGLAPAAIRYRTFDLATLTVSGGAGADTFDVNGTAHNVSGPAATVLNAGGGADTVNVRATTGPLAVNAGAGKDAVNVGGVFNTLDPILGAVTVDGQAESDVLTINDQGSTGPHVYTQTPTSLARSGAAAVNFFRVETLKVNKGSTNTGGTPPQLQDLSLPQAAARILPIRLSGRLVDPDSADGLTVSVDWGDGSAPVTASPGRTPFSFTHRYPKLGRFTVRITFTDGTGQSNFVERQVSVVRSLHQLAPAARPAFGTRVP